MIAKKIHYVWFGKKPYSKLIEKCINSWKEKLPDYEFILWNEDNSPIERSIYLQRALKKKYYAFAADYVRFYALYNYGGIYLDTDMEVVKNFDPLLENKFFIGYESSNLISAGIIGAKQKCEISKVILEYLDNSNTYETIPLIITKLFKEYNFINKDNIKIFPSEYFYPYNPYDKEREGLELMYMDITQNTYAIHHWGKSWKLSYTDRLLRKIKRIIN